MQAPEPGECLWWSYNPLAWTVTTIITLTVDFLQSQHPERVRRPVLAQVRGYPYGAEPCCFPCSAWALKWASKGKR